MIAVDHRVDDPDAEQYFSYGLKTWVQITMSSACSQETFRNRAASAEHTSDACRSEGKEIAIFPQHEALDLMCGTMKR